MNMAEKVGEWRTGMVVGFAEVVDADVRKLFHLAVEGRHVSCGVLVMSLVASVASRGWRRCREVGLMDTRKLRSDGLVRLRLHFRFTQMRMVRVVLYTAG